MVQIPLIAVPNQELNIILNGQSCTIAIYQRSEHVYLDLYVGSELIRQGSLCIPTAPILSKPCNFSGQLYIVDFDSQPSNQANPNYTELGSRFKLYYVTEDEEAQIQNDRYNRI